MLQKIKYFKLGLEVAPSVTTNLVRPLKKKGNLIDLLIRLV